ncbi:unnamed protein product [Staurois parvus]|uniref:Uncharacterized protein n=1 Tax=Staurois parvus TaxID=386267 RepID=A0ABN9D3V0_9NEOB|nr:unnamed protein product [Staurois parvus]
MISVAPAVPPVSVHQCQLLVLISATCQCPSVHINATYQYPSELPFSVTHQCQSMPPISAANQCQSVPTISAIQCQLSVPCSSMPPISVHQCSLSVPITAASLAHISEGEKSLI